MDLNNNPLHLIEYNGIQHYKYTKIWHINEKGFEESKLRDKLKIDYCTNNNIPLLVIKYGEDIMEKISGVI